MHHVLLQVLGLLFVMFILVMVANKLKVAYPIFLVISGLIITLIPGTPKVHLEPELIFLIFLPPLLYEAAWNTSWHDFWKWRRPIALLAFGLVFFTSMVIGYSALHIIPGFTLGLGFLLGGIVSPPDAIAAATVMKYLPVPKRILTILEGESLVNDASSLIVFKFALLSITTGFFSLQEATGDFFVMAGMGIAVGIAGAHVMYLIHRFLPTNPAIDAALSIMTPYILFLAAEHFEFSGVLAVVSGGLFLSYRSHEIFQNGVTRINMLSVWNTVIFVMNALVFILIGLQLPDIMDNLGDYTLAEAIKYGLIISAITIGLRYLWVYPATYIPRWLSRKVRNKEPNPGWKGPLVICWAGMRGIVSLATAMSIPVFMTDGSIFPLRNLIIFITFVVIFVTLVFQGLTLPLVIRWLKLKEPGEVMPEDLQEATIKLRLNKIALGYLEHRYNQELTQYDMLLNYYHSIQQDNDGYQERILHPDTNEYYLKENQICSKIILEVYQIQRKELFKIKKEKKYNDEILRKTEKSLDIKELKILG